MIYTPNWVNKIQDKLSIATTRIKPLLAIQWGFGSMKWPNPFAVRVQTFTDTESLYMNGIVFFGIQWPFFVNFMFRWSRTDFVQMHAGWRPIDGAPVIVFRIQSDASAQGGLVGGFMDGPK